MWQGLLATNVNKPSRQMQAGTSLFQQGERISAALGVFTVGNVGQGDVRAAGIEDVVGQVEVGDITRECAWPKRHKRGG